jgi:hypothetical protein
MDWNGLAGAAPGLIFTTNILAAIVIATDVLVTKFSMFVRNIAPFAAILGVWIITMVACRNGE